MCQTTEKSSPCPDNLFFPFFKKKSRVAHNLQRFPTYYANHLLSIQVIGMQILCKFMLIDVKLEQR